jgi:cysteine desulfurase
MKALFGRRTYLDWASAAPVSRAARAEFSKALSLFGNPSSPHAEGSLAHDVLEQARIKIARIAGIKASGVIFTSGATEANSLAILGHVRARGESGEIDMKPEDMHVLYLPTAHASVVETMKHLADAGMQVEKLVLSDGRVDLAALKKQLRPETVLVSMDVVCGETGTKYDTRDVRRVLNTFFQETKVRVTLHVDASQAPFVESIDCNHLGADLLTLDAQKIGGVRGIGALLRTNPSVVLAPLVYGGGQEEGLRPGTQNPALAAAFACALEEANNGREEFVARAEGARAFLLQQFPNAQVNVGKEYAPHILNISFPGIDTDYAVMLLSEAGFAVSTKSACETDEVGSRVVLELTGDSSRAQSTLRISWGPSTKRSEIMQFAKVLTRTILFLYGPGRIV